VFDDDIAEFAKAQFLKVSQKYNITLEEFNHDCDHVHILFRANPNSELSKFINTYKSSTSRMIKTNFPEVKTKLCKSSFWTKSYCLLTTGGASIEAIRSYIETQGT
jgi:putative transposase